jgi:hypothetical protein
MTTLKKDFFKRPTRMQHGFEETAKIDDPLGRNTFEFRSPLPGREKCTPGFDVQRHGLHDTFSPARSPVQKPNGQFASINGPSVDEAEAIGAPWPVGVKRRKDFLKTSK